MAKASSNLPKFTIQELESLGASTPEPFIVNAVGSILASHRKILVGILFVEPGREEYLKFMGPMDNPEAIAQTLRHLADNIEAIVKKTPQPKVN